MKLNMEVNKRNKKEILLLINFYLGIPKSLLPFQSGVGNVANAVLACIGKKKILINNLFLLFSFQIKANDNRFKSIEMYTEVIQDSIFDLIDSGKLRFASTTALTFSTEGQHRFFNQLNELKSKFILRPMEISNNPEVIRRIGLITMNTALEADIYGNVNSTHVLGSSMMNGIGGSGDFTRNAVRIFQFLFFLLLKLLKIKFIFEIIKENF